MVWAQHVSVVQLGRHWQPSGAVVPKGCVQASAARTLSQPVFCQYSLCPWLWLQLCAAARRAVVERVNQWLQASRSWPGMNSIEAFVWDSIELPQLLPALQTGFCHSICLNSTLYVSSMK
jgi:hypothetical protein